MAGFFKCTHCGRVLPTSQGLKSHTTRLHKGVDADAEDVSVSYPSSQTFVKTVDPPCPASQLNSGTFRDGQFSSESLGLLLANLRSNTRILERIPKGARYKAAEVLADTIDKCVRDNSEDTWERLLLFAAVSFQVSDNKDNRKVSLATVVNRNIDKFLQGQTPNLCHITRTESNSQRDPSQLANQVEAKVADGDVAGAVRIMCSEASLAPFNEETKQLLLEMHPAQELPTRAEGFLEETRTHISDAEIRGAIISFPPGSAGGLDMLRPQHLKDLTGPGAGPAGQRLLASIGNLCNIMLAGKVPSEICPILYGASLCALTKKTEGVRPIAVGSTWRRLVGKVGSFRIRPRLSETFGPIQVGFGIKGGAEGAAHAARRFVNFDHKETKVFLKVDFRNAFNSVDRSHLLQLVSEEIPELYPFLFQCYGTPSLLAFGEEILSSSGGIQQGDPLGPALFCLAVHPIATAITSELNVWFLDDATLGGRPEEVLKDFNMLSREAATIGLTINFSKCELIVLSPSTDCTVSIQNSFRETAPGIRFPKPREYTLLGAPLTYEAIAECLDKKSQALGRMSSRLAAVKAHVAFYLLKNSQAIPKLTYLLRCAPTWKYESGLVAFDDILRNALESVTNTRLEHDAWEQSALPVSNGGLGIRHAVSLAVPSFLASVHRVSGLTRAILPEEVGIGDDPCREEGIGIWTNKFGGTLPEGPKRCFQGDWETPGVELSTAGLYERAAKLQDKARLVGTASRESGAFLNALPSAPLGTLLDNGSFRIALALRLGAQVCEEHTCICGKEVDKSGVHGLSCLRSGGRRSRHSAVNDLIRRALRSANVPAILEPPYLSSSDNSRPDGITQFPWAQGKALVWDFTCTDSLAAGQVAASSREPLYAAKMAEQKKRRKYAHLGQAYLFAPVAVECFGSFGKDSLKVLRDIGSRITDVTGERRATEYLLQRISVAVQRGNAACVLGTIPSTTSLEGLFDII